ncbi:hypothetical protein [Pseudomonas sp. KNUC1026]|uniref:hypothetical protein n=1 Tax=Pseudomonas sp. KNUC1026 TaxID=2893890 RepID=UPI001F2C3DE2|nr:hypothetical protein [Pseudomonas sp. KNUC1026]UFH49202.1 hypothetical protein LN139_20260 [Pseudomonas sp. KNUC1026]
MTASCSISTNNSIEKFEENRSILRIHNQNRKKLLRHQVDGCLIKSGIKCDWMLVEEKTKTEIYIELKGSDVEHAVDQISKTVEQLSDSPPKKWGYVICTRSPMSATEIQRATKSIAKSHGVTLRIRKTIHDENIENLIR